MPTPLCPAFVASLLVAALGTSIVHAGVLVNDTWKDANRNEPAPPVYSEMGVDSDADTDLESVWYGNSSSLSNTAGHLIHTQAAGSTSYTTYFTPADAPVTLGAAGDQLKITWVFTPTGVATAGASQTFRLAVVDWHESALARLTSDAAPGTSTYSGFALFGNMKTGTLGHSSSFQLLQRADATVAGALLSAGAAWTTTDFTNSTVNNTTTPGYTEGAQLTFVMTITRNASDGLDVAATMTGAGLGQNNQGFLFQSATDAAPASYSFDTFSLRPSTAVDTAAVFDTTLFKVETNFNAVPEPASLAVLSLGGMALLARRRRA